MHKYHLLSPFSKFFLERERETCIFWCLYNICINTRIYIGTWPLIGRWSCCWCSSFGSWCPGPGSLDLKGSAVPRLDKTCHRPLEGMAEPWKTKHYHKVSSLKSSSRYWEDLSGSPGQWGQAWVPTSDFCRDDFVEGSKLYPTSTCLLTGSNSWHCSDIACTCFILRGSVQWSRINCNCLPCIRVGFLGESKRLQARENYKLEDCIENPQWLSLSCHFTDTRMNESSSEYRSEVFGAVQVFVTWALAMWRYPFFLVLEL